jgi:nicotinamidase-related amidase
MKALIVIDMQNDFITGSLGSSDAEAIVPAVIEKIKECKSKGYEIIATRDTHYDDYEATLEGVKLPIRHCIYNTEGWQIADDVSKAIDFDIDMYNDHIINKNTFGYKYWLNVFTAFTDDKDEEIEEVEICGLCTDICVISNALILRASFPDLPITVDAKCCAGTSVEAHKAALTAMKSCQIDVINE